MKIEFNKPDGSNLEQEESDNTENKTSADFLPDNRKKILTTGLFGTSSIVLFLFVLAVCGFIYFTMGLFVIQPIGAIPEGTTVVYWRHGTKLPFVSSADGLLLEKGEGISLLSRGLVLSAVAKLMEDRRIMNLPYSETLYLAFTGGVQFEK